MYTRWEKGKGREEDSDSLFESSSEESSVGSDSTEAWSPIYSPLPDGDYIRLLILQPGDYDDDIECELKVQTHRRSKNKYAAISYVWGDPTDTIDIECNHHPVPITRNLADALRQFRHPRTIRKLWADALCINQRDVTEKSIQVGRMGRVFQNAVKVLVWLGADREDIAKDCFQMIKDTNDYLDEQFIQSGRYYASMPRLRAPYPIPVDKKSWLRVGALLSLSWFDRVWTVQECALAKECHMFWGAHRIDIADVFEISLWCRENVDLHMLLEMHGLGYCGNLRTPFEKIHCLYGRGHGWQSSKPVLSYETELRFNSTFIAVLNTGKSFQAADPRDHVFAFLDCPPAKDEQGRSIIQADYSMSLEQVWHNVARTLVKHPGEGPWMLSAVQHGDRDVIVDSSRPSWIPYWNMYHNRPMLADPVFTYEAGGPVNTFLATPRRGHTLEIAGFLFDEIVWRSDRFELGEFTLHQFQEQEKYLVQEPFVDKLWREAKLAAEKLGLTLDEEAFMMTLAMEEADITGWFGDYRGLFQAYCEVVRAEYRGLNALDSQSPVDEAMLSKAVRCMDYLNASTRDNCLFLMRNGRVGLASGAVTEVGDLCCVFSGVSVPFLLTPAANRWHKLVSECFVYGAMSGQLLLEYEAGPIFLE
ncbi:uncharacterized protein EKO05_0010483 [Ascochyta rabiei]|uniref:Uncharacterized protein n=1 Tax=Didymella rabiei TaxID=5454 RepID=A0A163KZV8_DIDRA|nr:uncharacterized protein EKO05_0010483 [Ascochyta rabiei]KZM27384.1 hypothetical protein ST47_g1471 [Ascochyta rabiei]UPX20243.1 hypothetical protein EKO05_0010483 [Ascochyta rabiei]